MRELARQTASASKLVVMVRDPVATVASAHFRRHLRDQAFETTASDLYAHHGVLDEQLRRAAAPTLFIHYEDLVDRHNFRNATERIAGFLGYDADVVRGARQPRGLGEIAGPRRRRGAAAPSRRAADASKTNRTDKTSTRFFYCAQVAPKEGDAKIERQDKTATPAQLRYVDFLFLLAPAAPRWYPTCWPALQRYRPAARRRADANVFAALEGLALGGPA